MKKAQAAMAAGAVDERILLRMDAMITSMTPKERTKPELINAKRKIRIAKGSGTTVQDVNKLLKMHLEMQTAMKKIRKMGGIKGLGALFGKGGMAGVGNALGGAQMGDMMGKLDPPAGLPGLGGPGMPKLPPGFENFMKKK
jgi:signal recognition particle subunit SRP54